MERWFPTAPDEPHDQQRDLGDGHWAEVGPADLAAGRWSWSVMTGGGDVVADGLAAGEDDAKAAVSRWARTNNAY